MPKSVSLHNNKVRRDSLAGQHRLLPLAAAAIAAAPFILLGGRERQVADLVLSGASNAEVAQELSMALRTVKAHLNKTYMRYGITSGSKRVKFVLMHRRANS